MLKSRTYLCFAISILLVINACREENDIADKYYPHGNQLDTIIQDGLIRTYILHVPNSYSVTTKHSLVIALHGYSSNAADFEKSTKLSVKADSAGFIVAYPNGLAYPWTASNPQAWNAGGDYEANTLGTDDVGFLNQMIDLICKYYTIDKNRIFATGHSNGSFMAYRLGYESSNKIAAIAAHSGQMIYQPTKSLQSKIYILHLHAINDPSVPYFGGTIDAGYREPVDTVLCRWASWLSCNSRPDTIFINSSYLVKAWTSVGDTLIKSYVINYDKHSWLNKTNSSIDATDIIWEFFKTHPKH